MISCSKAKEMMDSYLDGDISEADMTAFEDHISTCDDCRELYEFISQTTSALKRSIQQPPADFAARVMERVRLEAARPAKQNKIVPFLHGWKAYGSAAAAVLLLAVIGKTAVYDRYLDVIQPPVDTAYVADAPGIPDARIDQNPQTAQPQTQPAQEAAEPSGGAAAPVQPASEAVSGTPEQLPLEEPSSGQPSAADTEMELRSMGGGESVQTAEEQPQSFNHPAQADPAAGQADSQTADLHQGQRPLLKSSMAEQPVSEPESATENQAVAAARQPAETAQDTADQAVQAYAAPSVTVGTANGGGSSAGTAGGGASSGGGAAAGAGSVTSGGGGGAAESASAQTAKVCHVTISKSGEGNLLAVQRHLSAVIDGTINSSSDQLVVTINPADFAFVLAEIEATGFVVDVQTIDSTGTQTVFYIQ